MQWNGLTENSGLKAIGRNAGEAIGVFGTLDWSERNGFSISSLVAGTGFYGKHISYKSSVNVLNLRRIEIPPMAVAITAVARAHTSADRQDAPCKWQVAIQQTLRELLIPESCATIRSAASWRTCPAPAMQEQISRWLKTA